MILFFIIFLLYSLGQFLSDILSNYFSFSLFLLLSLNALFFSIVIITIFPIQFSLKVNIKKLIKYFFLYLFCFLLNYFLVTLFLNGEVKQHVKTLLPGENFAFTFFSIVLFIPIFEELLYRHVLVEKLLLQFSKLKTIILSALLFSIFHFESSVIVSLGIFNLGFFLSYIYINSEKNIFYTIFFHCLNNFISYASL